MARVWTPWHALGLLVSCAASAILHAYWPLSSFALGSFSALIVATRGRFTPRGRFGAPNAVTAFRLLLALSLPVFSLRAPNGLVVAMVLLVLTLDVVDGWLARRLRCASDFGATFDMETDATFVLVVSLLLWERNGLGLWILVPGILRYVYVLCLAVWPSQGESPRSTFGRYALAASSLCLTTALALHGFACTLSAVLGAAMTCISFARSFRASYPSIDRVLASTSHLPHRHTRAALPARLVVSQLAGECPLSHARTHGSVLPTNSSPTTRWLSFSGITNRIRR